MLESMAIDAANAKEENASSTFIIRRFESRDVGVVRDLFVAYSTWLGFDLSYQNYDDELRTLPGKYDAKRRGALLLAVRSSDINGEQGDDILGCVALRPIHVDGDGRDPHPADTDRSGSCEIKRLYVTPQARGLGVGAALIAATLNEADKLAYARIYLDTLPTMHGALAIYRRFGFVETAPYYTTPITETVFFVKQLSSNHKC